jgi:hypothetical protein
MISGFRFDVDEPCGPIDKGRWHPHCFTFQKSLLAVRVTNGKLCHTLADLFHATRIIQVNFNIFLSSNKDQAVTSQTSIRAVPVSNLRRTHYTQFSWVYSVPERNFGIKGKVFRSALFRHFTQRRMVVSYRPLKMEPIGCPETSLRNYNSTLCKTLKECRSHLYCRGSLKSCILILGIRVWGGGSRGTPPFILTLGAMFIGIHCPL